MCIVDRTWTRLFRASIPFSGHFLEWMVWGPTTFDEKLSPTPSWWVSLWETFTFHFLAVLTFSNKVIWVPIIGTLTFVFTCARSLPFSYGGTRKPLLKDWWTIESVLGDVWTVPEGWPWKHSDVQDKRCSDNIRTTCLSSRDVRVSVGFRTRFGTTEKSSDRSK